MPIWSAPAPNPTKPLGGFPQVPNVTNRILFYGSDTTGNYNHAAMISYHSNFVTVSWKNGLGSNGEDKPGQRVLYTQTLDGVDFTPPSILFPSLSSPALPTALFAGPFAVLNGHLYASATPGVITTGDEAAQGSQFCLWPDGLEPRNAGPPLQKQPMGTLLMRRVLDGQGGLGPLFWATTNLTPPGFLPFATLPILTANETDEATQLDIFSPSFTASMPSTLPCDDSPTGTLKCEAVAGGGQNYQHLTSDPPGVGIANERSHWVIPATNPTWGGGDMMVYRSSSSYASVLLSAFRPAAATGGGAHASAAGAGAGAGTTNPSAPSSWGPTATVTAFPNDQSNINAGALPKEAGGGVFLVLNALPHSERDPLVIATSRDGVNFTAAAAIVSCTHLGPVNSPCGGRKGSKEGYGPSYPQGLTVVDPAPAALQGMWVVSTNNKEDVLLSRFPYSALLD